MSFHFITAGQTGKSEKLESTQYLYVGRLQGQLILSHEFQQRWHHLFWYVAEFCHPTMKPTFQNNFSVQQGIRIVVTK